MLKLAMVCGISPAFQRATTRAYEKIRQHTTTCSGIFHSKIAATKQGEIDGDEGGSCFGAGFFDEALATPILKPGMWGSTTPTTRGALPLINSLRLHTTPSVKQKRF